MSKIRKSFLKGSAMMLSLVAVMALSSSVAQAQECFAFPSDANTVRAEGVTEMVGSILLTCRNQDSFGQAPVPTNVKVSVTVNTMVTNALNSNRAVQGLTYTAPATGTALGTSDVTGTPSPQWTGGTKTQILSSDGMTISWEIPSADLGLATSNDGASIIIGGIMADASMVGNGEDVTATVMINDVTIEHSPVKLADVKTGLEITVKMASGLQCEVSTGTTAKTATVTFKEGFVNAIMATSETGGTVTGTPQKLVLNFSGIPDGVTVTPSENGTGTPMDPPADDTATPAVPPPGDLAPLTLATGNNSGVDNDGNVVLSAGRGSITYTFDDEDADTDNVREGLDDAKVEWNDLTITFTWKAGEPAIGAGSASLSYHPVTTSSATSPRFVSGASNEVVKIDDCDSSMTFPFVTNMHGYNTGIAITNTSEENGMCILSFVGMNAPADDEEMAVMGESVVTFSVSAMAPNFQGFVTASCDFRNGKGFAFIANGYGSMGGPTAAQGYLVATDIVESD